MKHLLSLASVVAAFTLLCVPLTGHCHAARHGGSGHGSGSCERSCCKKAAKAKKSSAEAPNPPPPPAPPAKQ